MPYIADVLVRPTGGGASISVGDMAALVAKSVAGVSVAQFGAKGDGQAATTTVTMAVGQSTLTVGAAIFAPGDVGKVIGVVRTDVLKGFSPWWGTMSGYTSIAKIARYVDARNVVIDRLADAAPTPDPVNYSTQSWPYAATPSLVMWGTDNGAAFQAALNAGGDVYVAGGTYCIASQLVIPSRTRLRGARRASTLLMMGVASPMSSPSGYIGIINSAYKLQWMNYEAPGRIGGDPALLRPTVGDTDISIQDLSIDIRMSGQNFGGTLARFFLLQGGRFSGLHILGTPNMPIEAPNFIGCDAVDVHDCYYDTVAYGWNIWGGCTNMRFHHNTVIVTHDPAPSHVWGDPHSGAWINVVGTQASNDTQKSFGLCVTDNMIFLNGSERSTRGPVGFGIFPANLSTVYSNCDFSRNRIECLRTANRPVLCNGTGVNLRIANNIISGNDGTGGPTIQITPQPSTSNRLNLTSVSSVSGSTLVTLHWTAHSFDPVYLALSPVWFYCVSGPTVGGLTLNGFYRIASAPDANTLVITAASAASSTDTKLWNSAFAQMQSMANGVTIAGNQMLNCNAPASYLISTQGVKINVKNNTATFSPGIAPNYLSAIRCDGVGTEESGYVSDNVLPAGSGDLGTLGGDNTVCWSSFFTAPSMEVDSVTTFTPSLQFGGLSTGITYNRQEGWMRRVGGIAFLEIAIELTSKGSATGAATVVGLPAAVSGITNCDVAVAYYANMSGLSQDPRAIMQARTILLTTNATRVTALADTNIASNTFIRLTAAVPL